MRKLLLAVLPALLLLVTFSLRPAAADDLPHPGELIRHQRWTQAERFAREAARYAEAITPDVVCPTPGATFVDSWHAPRVGHLHIGVDAMEPDGSIVVAPQAGTYEPHGSESGYLHASDGSLWFFTHLTSSTASGEVLAGDPVAISGHSGNASASAPHTHTQYASDGVTWENPYPIMDRLCNGQPAPVAESAPRRYYPAPRPTFVFGPMETQLYVNSFRPQPERIDRLTATKIAVYANLVVANYLRRLTPSCSPGDMAGCERLVRVVASRYGVNPDDAVSVARCESTLNPSASNGSHGGLFQQDISAFPSRASSRGFGGRSVFDAEANASVSMMMVREDGGWRQWSCSP